MREVLPVERVAGLVAGLGIFIRRHVFRSLAHLEPEQVAFHIVKVLTHVERRGRQKHHLGLAHRFPCLPVYFRHGLFLLCGNSLQTSLYLFQTFHLRIRHLGVQPCFFKAFASVHQPP